jgi:hypothetical protein
MSFLGPNSAPALQRLSSFLSDKTSIACGLLAVAIVLLGMAVWGLSKESNEPTVTR